MSISDRLPHAGARSLGLDLMRAAAIVLVLIAHWSNNLSVWLGLHPPPQIFFTGDLGVQLFFALSGFLIGAILIEQAAADPSLRNFGVFMIRRWMRTLPLYFLILAVMLKFFTPPGDVRGTALAYATMTQNLFGPMPTWFPVTWSLTIEEWFYLLFGGSVFLVVGLVRRPWAIWIPIVLFTTVPLGLRLFTPDFFDWSKGLAKMVVFRLDAIAFGVAMAQCHRQGSRLFEHPRVALACGLTLILLAWNGWVLGTRFFPATVYTFVIVGCVLLIPPALKLQRLPRWLEVPIRAISAWSYCLYLVHLTILVDWTQQTLWGPKILPTWACVALATLSPFVLAWLSFRYLESPILKLRPRHGRRAESPAAMPEPVPEPIGVKA